VTTIVVPFRGANGKSRLPEGLRGPLATAMLGDVLAACTATAQTTLVTDEPDAAALADELGARLVADPGGGQGAAVAAGLGGLVGPALVVNSDLPCVEAADLLALAAPAEAGLFALAEALDGTTNALALPDPSLFVPLYGPGSAARFREHARRRGLHVVSVAIPHLVDDVDTEADLARIGSLAGPRTRAVVAVPA
jgi:2-phospho-L-lactate guanylyltransferase